MIVVCSAMVVVVVCFVTAELSDGASCFFSDILFLR